MGCMIELNLNNKWVHCIWLRIYLELTKQASGEKIVRKFASLQLYATIDAGYIFKLIFILSCLNDSYYITS